MNLIVNDVGLTVMGFGLGLISTAFDKDSHGQRAISCLLIGTGLLLAVMGH